MATKTTTKATTKAAPKTAVKSEVTAQDVAEETIDSTVKTETAAKTVESKVEKTKKTFTDSDYILCRSVWSGGLNIISQSGNLYEFKDYGSECEINYRDLVTLIRRGSEHVFMPRFVILDEDFLEDFPTIKNVYGEMYTMDDLVDILKLPIRQMTAEIAKLPESIKGNMRTLVATEIADGRLDSIAKVRELSTIFDSDFNLLSDLFVK